MTTRERPFLAPDLEALPGAILDARHLKKDFPLRRFNPFAPKRAVHAVEDASLALFPGRAVALVGESGSGKTTIARMLARLYSPSAGTISFQGEQVQLKGGRYLSAYRRNVQLI